MLPLLSVGDLRAELMNRGATGEISFHTMQALCHEIIKRSTKAVIVFEIPQSTGNKTGCMASFSSPTDALGLLEWCRNEINARAEFVTHISMAKQINGETGYDGDGAEVG